MENQIQNEVWCTLSGGIDPVLVNRVFNFFSTLVNNHVQTVHLMLHSTGGYINDGVCLYNYFKNLPMNIVMYNSGNVSSIAVIVFLAANKRIGSKSSTFMIHKSHSSPAGGITSAKLKELASSLDIDNFRTEAILKEYVKLPEEKWLLHEIGDLTITAEEAKDYGLLHEVGNFSPPPNSQLFNI